jgi:hypothetical protein
MKIIDIITQGGFYLKIVKSDGMVNPYGWMIQSQSDPMPTSLRKLDSFESERAARQDGLNEFNSLIERKNT